MSVTPSFWGSVSPRSVREVSVKQLYSSRSRSKCVTVGNSLIVSPVPQRPRTSASRQNTLRQIYGAKCEITLLGENSYVSYTPRPLTAPRLYSWSSTNTSSGPYSTDILYGGDIDKSGTEYRLAQSSLIDLNRVKEKNKSEGKEQRKSLYSRDSLSTSVDKGSLEKDERVNPSMLQTSHCKVNQFRPNGVRNSLVTKGRGCQDELVAMGTIWNPNHHPKPLRTLSVCTNSNSSASTAVPRRVSSVTVPAGSYRHILSLPNTQQHPINKTIANSQEPKYGDPLVGAPPQYQQRLAELSTLEADTVRYERTRKLKKKQPKQDRDS